MSDPYGFLFSEENVEIKSVPIAVVPAKRGRKSASPKADPKVYKTYEDFDPPDMYTYAGIDTHVTSNVFAKSLFPKLIEKPTYYIKTGNSEEKCVAPALIDIYQQCTRPIFDFICDLEMNGINYDQKENRRLHKSMQEDIKQLEDSIFNAIGQRINLDSSLEVSKLLYETKGFEVSTFTKSGEASTSGDVLLHMAGLNPLAPGDYKTEKPELQFLADMARRKNLASVHRSFIATYMDDYLKRDGRIHALYNQFGTSTFRLSSSEPFDKWGSLNRVNSVDLS